MARDFKTILKMKVIFVFSVILFLSKNTLADEKNDLNYKEIDRIEEVLETNFPFSDETKEEKDDKDDFEFVTPGSVKQKTDFKAMESSIYFSDLAVIQRNYMPKSERFQFNLSLTSVPSDAFFTTAGLTVRSAYHFNETWGLEAFATLLSSNPRDEVSNIANNQGVKVSNLTSLKSFAGVNIYHNLIYGKLSILDKSVMPFEIFTLGGLGVMVSSNDFTSPSAQIGAGGLFSIQRSQTLRADMTFALHQMKSSDSTSTIESSTFVSLGYSWLWPEPDYR